MAYLDIWVLDNGLSYLTARGQRLDICYQEPTTFLQATVTYSLGYKTPLVIPAPSALISPAGRRVLVPAITDGIVTASSTGTVDDAQFWAITDVTNSALLAAGLLAAPDLVTVGDGFTLPAFSIGFPFPT